MIQREGRPASLNALARQGDRGVSLSQSHQRVCGQCQNTEHQVSHRFGVPLDHEVVSAELILESRIAALGGGTLVVSDCFGRGELDLLATPRVMIDQGDMAQASAMVTQPGAAIGGIHQVVEVDHALGTDQRQGDGGTTVVHRGARKQCGDGHATVSRVEVQLVAVPTDLAALGIALRAAVARRGDVLEHLRQRLPTLAMNGRFLGGGTDFAAPGPATLPRRGRRRFRSTFLRRDQDGLCRGLDWAFALRWRCRRD